MKLGRQGMNVRGICVPIAVAACLGVAACGGDDGGGDTLSKSELAKEATEICEAATKEGEKIETPSDISDADAAADYFSELVDLTQKQTDDLNELEPADDIKDDWDAYIEEQQAATDLLKETRDAAENKDVSGLTNFQEKSGKVAADVDAAGAKVGVDC